MGRYWAIQLWIILQKIGAVLVAIGSVWLFLELQVAAAQGIRDLSFLGLEISTDLQTAIHVAPIYPLVNGLILSLALYASAQFLGLLVDLMTSALRRLDRTAPAANPVPSQRRDLWAEN